MKIAYSILFGLALSLIVFLDFQSPKTVSEETSSFESVEFEKTDTTFQANEIDELPNNTLSILPFETCDLEPSPVFIETENAEYSEQETSFFKKIKNVNPPIKGIEAPYEIKIISKEDLKSDLILSFNNGANLSIPANTLVLKNGEAINEDIELAYMQLNNPVDGFLSGVPMSYDSAGVGSHFQTAGMFRLEAKSLSGKEVIVQEGKQVELEMPTVDNSDDYNFYEFKQDNGAWEFDGIAPPVKDYSNFKNEIRSKIDFDTTLFSEKFASSDHCFLYHKQKDLGSFIAPMRGHTKDHKRCKTASYRWGRFRSNPLKLFRLQGHSRKVFIEETQEIENRIFFQFAIQERNRDYFTELRPFRYYTFMVKDMTKSRDFYAKYSRQKRYNDIRIQHDEGSNELTLFLKHDKGIDTLIADLTKGGNRIQISRNIKDIKRRMARYNRDLKKREECHDIHLKRKIQNHIKQVSYGTAQSRNGIFRTISLMGFGIYNCDKIYKMKNPIQYVSKKFIHQDSLLTGYTVHVLDPVARGSFAFSSSNFTLSGKNTIALIMVDLNGDIYTCSGKNIVEQRKNSFIKLNKMDSVPQNYHDFKSLFE